MMPRVQISRCEVERCFKLWQGVCPIAPVSAKFIRLKPSHFRSVIGRLGSSTTQRLRICRSAGLRLSGAISALMLRVLCMITVD